MPWDLAPAYPSPFFSAYQLYTAMMKSERGKHSDVEVTKEVCEQFKRTLSHKDAVVHFVGVW